MGNGQSLQQRKAYGNKEVLQLVDRDTIEVYRQAGEIEHRRGSQAKNIFEPFTTVHGSHLHSTDQRRLYI